MTPAHLLRVKAVGGIYSPKGQNQNLCVQARERVIGAPNKKELLKKKNQQCWTMGLAFLHSCRLQDRGF